MSPTLQSIQIGQPQELAPTVGDTSDKPWRTAFFKQPVAGPIQATGLGLVGDGVEETAVHGGVDKAVCVYSAEHWPYWRERLEEPTLGAAAFGENFSVAGLIEEDVCLGDRWRIGDAEFEVSQPRQPCWKLARRWRTKQLTLWVQQNGYTGWYLRVVTEGTVTAGDAIERSARPLPDWTIARANQVMYELKDDRKATAELAAVGTLSDSWKRQLRKRIV
ncbi:MOSC domain-containing protein [Botrimarina colliarenosi]|uniref:MOSC domain-containing protein n=1 Tax=Botrimarina colliarenosi TaxID=2528001 RepID=UPI001E356682|nr:MOSC domain-containing protein [Botrimarina colliarenosi]